MRKIFLDCGAWNGTSAKFFRGNHPQGNEFEIFSFECLPENIKQLSKIPNINIIKKGVWIKDTNLRFYKGMTESGTFHIEKRTGGVTPDNYTTVPVIDFAKWIQNNLTKQDYIICKLNIEGAEYAVIKHLKQHGLIQWVDKWYIQWHWHKIKLDKSVHDRVQKMIPKWHSWNAMLNKVEEFKTTL